MLSLNALMSKLSSKFKMSIGELSMLEDELQRLKPGQTSGGTYNGHRVNVKREQAGYKLI